MGIIYTMASEGNELRQRKVRVKVNMELKSEGVDELPTLKKMGLADFVSNFSNF